VARVLLGVSGGVAAYKAVELVRLATARGHAVRVVQTPASRQFVGIATFEGVTGAPVLVDEFEADPALGAFPGDPAPAHDAISHLELVRRCDVYAIAPATANTLAKLANGQADNMLTSAALANVAPLVIAPAMNDRMWVHPATAANVETLRLRGATIVEPTVGRLASEGECGAGRLAEPSAVLAEIERVLSTGAGQEPRSLDGLRVLVTAGGTREAIDSVRYIGNRSSGRMGFALAAEAARRGADVTLVAANAALETPIGVHRIDVETVGEMDRAMRPVFGAIDVLLMAAAVSDFQPVARAVGKVEKTSADGAACVLDIDLEPTTDILASLAADRGPGQTIVGFAAEHGDGGPRRARAKLERKGLDAIVLNDIARSEIGFDSEDNEVTIFTLAGERHVPRSSKPEVAAAVIDEVEMLRFELPARRREVPGR